MHIKEMVNLYFFLNVAKAIFIASFLLMVCEKDDVVKRKKEAKTKLALERKPWERGLEHPVLRMVCCVRCLRQGTLTIPEKYTLLESSLFFQGWGLDGKRRPLCPDHRPNITMIDAI